MSRPDPPPGDWPALLRRGEDAALARAVEAALTEGRCPPAPAIEAAMTLRLECRQPEAALALWRRTGALAPEFLPGPDLLAALDRAGQCDSALALLRAQRPPPGAAGQPQRLRLAQALARLGAAAEAAAVFAEGLAISPGAMHFAQGLLRQAIAANDLPAIRAAADRVLDLPGAAPPWLWRFLGLLESGRIAIGPVTLALPAAVVPPALMLAFAQGGFETAEVGGLLADLRPGDRLMDLGAGSGFTAISAGLACPGLPILTVEANPALIPVIARNLSLNGVAAEVLAGIAGGAGGMADLALAAHFPASSVLHPDPGLPRLRLPRLAVGALQARFRPSIVVMDIEGAEAEVIPALNLAALRRLVVEFHPDLTGPATMSALLHRILAAGLVHDRAPERHVHAFTRPDAQESPTIDSPPGAA